MSKELELVTNEFELIPKDAVNVAALRESLDKISKTAIIVDSIEIDDETGERTYEGIAAVSPEHRMKIDLVHSTPRGIQIKGLVLDGASPEMVDKLARTFSHAGGFDDEHLFDAPEDLNTFNKK